MTKEYYECHITLKGYADDNERHVDESGWTFSAINGDPDLGPGVKCYATMQYNKRCGLRWVKSQLKKTADFLREKGCDVLREKIELVVHDVRQKKVMA